MSDERLTTSSFQSLSVIHIIKSKSCLEEICPCQSYGSSSFAIRLLVIYFRLVILLTSRGRALAGIGRPKERGRARRRPD